MPTHRVPAPHVVLVIFRMLPVPRVAFRVQRGTTRLLQAVMIAPDANQESMRIPLPQLLASIVKTPQQARTWHQSARYAYLRTTWMKMVPVHRVQIIQIAWKEQRLGALKSWRGITAFRTPRRKCMHVLSRVPAEPRIRLETPSVWTRMLEALCAPTARRIITWTRMTVVASAAAMTAASITAATSLYTSFLLSAFCSASLSPSASTGHGCMRFEGR